MEILKDFTANVEFCGDIKKDSITLLNHHGKLVTAEHTVRVAGQAKKLAKELGEDEQAAEIAGFLHDISVIIPNERRLGLAAAMDVLILPEERPYPFILHQKLSAALAKELFGVKDERILSAIGCHTTLKGNAQSLELILFIADKLQWDQSGTPPYMEELNNGIFNSLRHGAYAFINYQMEHKENLLMIHPWFEEAYHELRELCR